MFLWSVVSCLFFFCLFCVDLKVYFFMFYGLFFFDVLFRKDLINVICLIKWWLFIKICLWDLVIVFLVNLDVFVIILIFCLLIISNDLWIIGWICLDWVLYDLNMYIIYIVYISVNLICKFMVYYFWNVFFFIFGKY